MKVGMFVVSKGKGNPWIYRVKSIDPRVNCAYLQFMGHNKKWRNMLRGTSPDAKKDKWRSLAEITQASPDQLMSALAQPGENFRAVSSKLEMLSRVLDGAATPKYESNCNHEWKEYRGFSWDYKYCAKCDAKTGCG